jgi:hypothetical protein
MAKMTWDKFVDKHAQHVALAATVSSAVPLKLDLKKKTLPTPYGLFGKWAAEKMTADWTSKTFSGGFVVLLSSKEDAQQITRKFKVDPTPKKKEHSCRKRRS